MVSVRFRRMLRGFVWDLVLAFVAALVAWVVVFYLSSGSLPFVLVWFWTGATGILMVLVDSLKYWLESTILPDDPGREEREVNVDDDAKCTKKHLDWPEEGYSCPVCEASPWDFLFETDRGCYYLQRPHPEDTLKCDRCHCVKTAQEVWNHYNNNVSQELLNKARELYAVEEEHREIIIHDDARTFEADGGTWVEARVWIPTKE